jgi:mediator of RNA polymerase II transcription subunit 5
MNGHAAPAGLPAAVHQWHKFLAHALATRLDAETFASFAPLLYAKHRLPPTIVADLLLRPTQSNQSSLDPRAPQYLQALLILRLVDVSAILKALYKYSTSQAQVQAHTGAADASADGQLKKQPLRWDNSYTLEEVIFYRLVKTIGQAETSKAIRDALDLVRIVARWMGLLTDAAAAFATDAFGAIHSLQAKDEMEAARAAFVALLLAICENHLVLTALSKPAAKGEPAPANEPESLGKRR